MPAYCLTLAVRVSCEINYVGFFSLFFQLCKQLSFTAYCYIFLCVQSVATKLICDREEEIENFTPQEYWSIETVLHDPKSKKDFNAKYYGEKGKK